jgi:hypothetical protein
MSERHSHHDPSPQRGNLHGRGQVHDGVGDAGDEIGPNEDQRGEQPAFQVVVRFEHNEPGDEHRGHRDDHRDPHDALVGVRLVGEPAVRGPGPPEERENDQRLQDPQHVVLLRDQSADLGEREHVGEVKEKLEGRDPVTLLAYDGRQEAAAGRVGVRSHAAMLKDRRGSAGVVGMPRGVVPPSQLHPWPAAHAATVGEK